MTPHQAREALQAALWAAEGGEVPVPCTGERAERWTHDDRAHREWAARQCEPCPVLTECAQAAEVGGELWHVWAGVDRGDLPRKRKRSR